MIEKIYDNITSVKEINQLAADLRQTRQKDMLLTLAKKYNLTDKMAEDFMTGRRRFLVDGGDTASSYNTVKSKLVDEMMDLGYEPFAKPIGDYLLRQDISEKLENQILLPHKTLQRCIEYLMDKAYSMIDDSLKKAGRMLNYVATDETVYEWVWEYYQADDASKIAEKAAEADDKFQKNAASRSERTASAVNSSGKKTSNRKKNASSRKAPAGKASVSEQPKETKPAGIPRDFAVPQDSEAVKKEQPLENGDKTQVEGQFSLFDVLASETV